MRRKATQALGSPAAEVNATLARMPIWRKPAGWLLLAGLLAGGVFVVALLQASGEITAKQLLDRSAPVPIEFELIPRDQIAPADPSRASTHVEATPWSKIEVEITLSGTANVDCHVDSVPSSLWARISMVDSGRFPRSELEASALRARFWIDSDALEERGISGGKHRLLTVVAPEPAATATPEVSVRVYGMSAMGDRVLVGAAAGSIAGRQYGLDSIAFRLQQH